jgi:glycosyltransferase involved in cell wall biosynthesis
MSHLYDLNGLNIIPVPHAAEVLSSVDKINDSQLNLPNNYFFYPAQTTENKNHLCLFEAIQILSDKKVDVSVVFSSQAISRLRCGSVRTPHESLLRKWLLSHEHLLDTFIFLVGEVSLADVEFLYRRCHAVILPSKYEGFGLPLSEALERNVPVICSGIPPFCEQIYRYTMGDRCTILDPLNPESLASAMESSLLKPRIMPLSQNELENRIGAWTWNDAVRAYFNALSSLS